MDLVSSVQLDFLLMFYGLSVDVSFNYGLSSATVPAANVGMEKPTCFDFCGKKCLT